MVIPFKEGNAKITGSNEEVKAMSGFSRLNVLWRLIIGFTALFILTLSVSVYSISKLQQFNTASAYMLEMGEKMVEYKEKLSDALLSEVSYEKKYAISRDAAFRDRLALANKDFVKYLDEARAIADTLGSKEILDNIARHHSRYAGLIEEEAAYLASSRPYPFRKYKAEKAKSVEAMIEEIKNLEMYIEDDTKVRIDGLAKAGTEALRTAVIMACFSLFFGILIAAGITRSIIRPLSLMKKKTRDIARGNFSDPLALSAPPEIRELANSFNIMCRKLGEMDRMKSDFFSFVAHELRTPLASLSAGITLLKKHPERSGQDREKILAIMSEECARLIRQVNSLLDLSKMEAGIIDFDFTSQDVKPLLKKAVSEIEPLSASRNIRFAFNETGKCRPVTGDKERLLQVIRNLLGNAVKLSPDGSDIRISLEQVAGGIRISVSDSGPGIAEENRQAIFDKYKQADASVSAAIKGTGLGLAISKHIVDAHGGKIWVESELGKGSTFFIFLPG
ncbi:MAG: HAMP domain-containing sensor histidine kinase [Syntrophorhabdus sp.]